MDRLSPRTRTKCLSISCQETQRALDQKHSCKNLTNNKSAQERKSEREREREREEGWDTSLSEAAWQELVSNQIMGPGVVFIWMPAFSDLVTTALENFWQIIIYQVFLGILVSFCTMKFSETTKGTFGNLYRYLTLPITVENFYYQLIAE